LGSNGLLEEQGSFLSNVKQPTFCQNLVCAIKARSLLRTPAAAALAFTLHFAWECLICTPLKVLVRVLLKFLIRAALKALARILLKFLT